MAEPRSPVVPSPPADELDLTGPTTHSLDRLLSPSPSPSTLHFSTDMARFHRTTPTSFKHATRRLLQRERFIHRDRPDLAVERVQVAEISPGNPTRDAALLHGARAYAAVGYMYAALALVVTSVAAFFLIAVSRAIAADVARKTRSRAADLAATAAACDAKARANSCSVHGDFVTHASNEVAELCRGWVACARDGAFALQDARSAKVWAETLADIGNAFAERVSSATMVISLAFMVVLIFLVSSAAFGFLHRRVVGDVQLPAVGDGVTPSHADRADGQLNGLPGRSVSLHGTPVRRAITFDVDDEPPNSTPRRRIVGRAR